MPSTYAGLYQGQFYFPDGIPLIGSSFLVVGAGTTAPATVYSDGNYAALANPLPTASGPGQVGADLLGNVAFYGDTTLSYDIILTYPNGRVAPAFHVRLVPDTRVLPLPTGTPTNGQTPVVTTVSPLAMGWGSGGGAVLAAPFALTGALTPGVGHTRFLMSRAATIIGVAAAIDTPSQGAAVIADVLKNGTTIFTTQANRPTVAAGFNATTSSPTPDVTTVAAGDYLTVNVVQVGSTVAGSDLTVVVGYQ